MISTRKAMNKLVLIREWRVTKVGERDAQTDCQIITATVSFRA
jgi:hypothetical protein